jgi:molybdopterin-binding protein
MLKNFEKLKYVRYNLKYGDTMIGARNQLKGKVKEIVMGQVMAEIVVDCNGVEVVAVMTKRAVENMGLKEGDEVTACIKATEVTIIK